MSNHSAAAGRIVNGAALDPVALLPALLVLFIRRHVREPESTARLRADRRAGTTPAAVACPGVERDPDVVTFFGGDLGIAVTALNGFLVLGVIGALLSRETRDDYRQPIPDRASADTHL